MPVISRFLGIAVRVYPNDHAPPHFHAKYGEYEVKVEIESGIVSGEFPRRALGAVLDWYEQHIPELRDNWNRAQNHQPLAWIDPLE
jgi:hypothetical protein